MDVVEVVETVDHGTLGAFSEDAPNVYIVKIPDVPGFRMDDMRHPTGQSLPREGGSSIPALFDLSLDIVRFDPADLEGNDPGKIAPLRVPAALKQLPPVRPGQVNPFVRREVLVGIFRFAVVWIDEPVPREVVLKGRPIHERFDAHPAVVHPEDVDRLLFVKAALAGRRLVIPRNANWREGFWRGTIGAMYVPEDATLVPVEGVVAVNARREMGAGAACSVGQEAAGELLTVVVTLRHIRQGLVGIVWIEGIGVAAVLVFVSVPIGFHGGVRGKPQEQGTHQYALLDQSLHSPTCCVVKDQY